MDAEQADAVRTAGEGGGRTPPLDGELFEEGRVGSPESKRRRLLGGESQMVQGEGEPSPGAALHDSGEGEGGDTDQTAHSQQLETFLRCDSPYVPCPEGEEDYDRATFFSATDCDDRDIFGVRGWTEVQWEAFWRSRGFDGGFGWQQHWS